MSVATLGVKPSNVIVPVTNFTKRTKWINVASYITTNLNTVQYAWAQFTADSAGQWTMHLDTMINGGSVATGLVTIAGVSPKEFGTGKYQTITGQSLGGSPYSAGCQVEGPTDGGRIQVYSNGGSTSDFRINGLILLNAEPTWASLGTTASAVMENIVGMEAYIPFGQTGSPGETIEATISGDVTLTTGGSFYQIATLTLKPGKWAVFGKSRAGLNNGEFFSLCINTSIARDLKTEELNDAPTGSSYARVSCTYKYQVAVDTPIYLVGSVPSNSQTAFADSTYFYAIRLA